MLRFADHVNALCPDSGAADEEVRYEMWRLTLRLVGDYTGLSEERRAEAEAFVSACPDPEEYCLRQGWDIVVNGKRMQRWERFAAAIRARELGWFDEEWADRNAGNLHEQAEAWKRQQAGRVAPPPVTVEVRRKRRAYSDPRKR